MCKYSKAIKTVPIANNIKAVNFGDIDIFLRDNVGNLLTNKNAIKIVKYGVKVLSLNLILICKLKY